MHSITRESMDWRSRPSHRVHIARASGGADARKAFVSTPCRAYSFCSPEVEEPPQELDMFVPVSAVVRDLQQAVTNSASGELGNGELKLGASYTWIRA